MKKITVLLSLSFVLISACMIYLVWSGVSLRSAPMIRPSVISPDHRNIATGLVTRLFPELQNVHYILWGALPETADSQMVLSHLAEEYEKAFGSAIHIIRNTEAASNEELRQCLKPCFLMLPSGKAHELEPNEFIEKKIHPLGPDFISITWVPFFNDEKVPTECETQKRLTFHCLVPLSIRDVQKKMKDPNQLYFFLRKYNERGYFLFVQQPQPNKKEP